MATRREFECYEDTTGCIEEYVLEVDKRFAAQLISRITDITQFEKFEVVGNIYENPELLKED